MTRQRFLIAGTAFILSTWVFAGACTAGEREAGMASGFTSGSPYSFRPLAPNSSYSIPPAPGPRYGRFDNPIFMTSINFPGIYGAYSSEVAWTAYYDRSPLFVPDVAPASFSRAAVAATTARIDVVVPAADAELLFDNRPVNPSGLTREFITPPLLPGGNYVYNVRVTWVDDGVRRTRDKNVFVTAGDRLVVDLSTGAGNFEGPRLRVAPTETGSTLRTRTLP